MLQSALRANLPLICIQTDDPVNVSDVLAFLTGKTIGQVDGKDVTQVRNAGFGSEYKILMMLDAPEDAEWAEIYEEMASQQRTLVLVNPGRKDHCMFDAGVVRVPKEMLAQFLESLKLIAPESLKDMAAVLSGLSLKDVGEICRLTTTIHQELTPRKALEVRRQFVAQRQGVFQVDTNYPFYDPDVRLMDWLEVKGQVFMMTGLPKELVPRGMLFGGMEGCGKTMGAKFLANELGLPLYRVDLGAMMSKWHGESEGNLLAALAIVDSAEPCLLLIDEVEKAIQTDSDSGVTTRMLSTLLWWLQEHETRVFTVMTTNDRAKLPKELYRSGRIDRELVFSPMKNKEAVEFVKALVYTYGCLVEVYESEALHQLSKAMVANKETNQPEISQAAATQVVINYVQGKLVWKD